MILQRTLINYQPVGRACGVEKGSVELRLSLFLRVKLLAGVPSATPHIPASLLTPPIHDVR